LKYLAEPTSSNDEEDDDESENETHMIPPEVLMVKLIFSINFFLLKNLRFQQQRQRFQCGAPTNQEESDDDETITNVHTNLSQVNNLEFLHEIYNF
jgi:hypothetical protein